MRKCIFVFFVSCLLLKVNAIYAQSYPYKNFTSDDGLAGNIVYDAVQDNDGYMWFATAAGVSRFDGKNWKTFDMDDGLGDNEILRINKDASGKIWMFGFNGTISIIDKDSIFSGINLPLLKQFGPGFFYRFFFSDNKKKVWISNNRNANALVDFPKKVTFLSSEKTTIYANKFNRYLFNKRGKMQTPAKLIAKCPDCNFTDSLTIDRWYTSIADFSFTTIIDNYILHLSYEDEWSVFPIENYEPMEITDFYCDESKGIWISTEDKVEHLVLKNKRYIVDKNYMNSLFVTSTLRDSDKNIWFTTYGNGVYLMLSNFKDVLSYQSKDGLDENESYAVNVDSKGKIWVGHKLGKVDIIEGSKIIKLDLGNDFKSIGRILKIQEHPNGLMVISCDQGIFFIERDNPLHNIKRVTIEMPTGYRTKSQPIKDFVINNKGDLYLATQECIHLITSDNIKNKFPIIKMIEFPNKRIYTLAEEDGNLWYGDFDGLSKIEGKENILLYTMNPILKDRIQDICTDKIGTILALAGKGLVVLNGNNVSHHITTQNGLLSNHCTKLFLFNDELYVSTNKGINIIKFKDNKSFTIAAITTADGLLSNQINDLFVNENYIYTATLNGLSIIARKRPNLSVASIPKIYFTKIQWNTSDIKTISNPEIDYSDRYLKFEYISPDYASPENVQYKYSLNSDKWIQTFSSSLEFNALKPGAYTFRLAAKHLNSIWSKPLTYNFVINEPFYNTWTFYLFCFLLFCSIVYYIYMDRINRIKQEQALTLSYEQQINQLQMKALQAMMNPHFIFNSLSAIQQQINIGNSSKASTYLTRFSKLLRKNLETINENFVTIKEEIERIKLYLDAEKMRLGDKLNYRIEIDLKSGDEDLVVPTMIIQPMIENAIWHGILTLDDNGLVQLRIREVDNRLIIEIEDNGIGIDASQALRKTDSLTKQHFGLKITQERLKHIETKMKQAISFHTIDLSTFNRRGTLIRIELPIFSEFE